MRWFGPYCVWLALPLSCGGHAAPRGWAYGERPGSCIDLDPTRNTTGLAAATIPTPILQTTVDFTAPEFGEHVMVADPRSYRVSLRVAGLGPEIAALELALDGGRPRRLSPTEPSISLGELLSEDQELRSGPHWLFAAAVLTSGLVPRIAGSERSAAMGCRFFVGKSANEAPASGTVWLRRPDGSYNGPKSSQTVLFEAFNFLSDGTPTGFRTSIVLHSPKVNGELRLDPPFLLYDLPSGVYEVTASEFNASTSTHFNVNPELGEGS